MKTSRKVFAFALIAVLLLSISATASATDGFVSGSAWEVFTVASKSYTAAVHTTARVYQVEIFDRAEEYYHTFSVEDQAEFGGAYSETVTFQHETTSGSDFYMSYVHAAGEDLNLYDSFTVAGEVEDWSIFEINPAYPSGYYAVGVRFQGVEGTWSVASGITVNSLDNLTPAAVVLGSTGSGTISFAPDGTYYIAAYPCE